MPFVLLLFHLYNTLTDKFIELSSSLYYNTTNLFGSSSLNREGNPERDQANIPHPMTPYCSPRYLCLSILGIQYPCFYDLPVSKV